MKTTHLTLRIAESLQSRSVFSCKYYVQRLCFFCYLFTFSIYNCCTVDYMALTGNRSIQSEDAQFFCLNPFSQSCDIRLSFPQTESWAGLISFSEALLRNEFPQSPIPSRNILRWRLLWHNGNSRIGNTSQDILFISQPTIEPNYRAYCFAVTTTFQLQSQVYVSDKDH